MASVTYYSLTDYLQYKYHEKTFDLTFFTSFEEHEAAIKDWLSSLTDELNDGITRTDWLVADCKAVPEQHFVASCPFVKLKKSFFIEQNVRRELAQQTVVHSIYNSHTYIGYFETLKEFLNYQACSSSDAVGSFEEKKPYAVYKNNYFYGHRFNKHLFL
ncbi:hypothetical protein [Zooshikella sp. RANM57]|uniref:hypothetical protein n=1 Tax=Zooshikella sp. RANM57 TaxID=3425863 RepID=UPI003D6E71FC